MSTGLNSSVLDPAMKPPALAYRVVTAAHNGRPYRVKVTTEKCKGSPYHVYSVFYKDVCVLQLISNPGNDDIVDAIARHHK